MDNVFSDLRLNCSIDARKDWIDQVRLRASEVVAKASLVAVSSDILLQHAYPELKRYLSEPIGRASDSGLSCDDYQPSNALAIGDVVGDNYQIVRWIDDGGTASVYEAIQIGSKRRVAIKLFELRDAADETCAVAEAKLASELRHEHIVTVFSFFKDRHFVGICMELLEHSLLSINRRFSGCYQEIAQLLVQITTAVAYCHSNGIVHRDVGPHNILFLGNSPRIVDFGLA
ncbi:MAG: protein kinase, partial [Planctomycetota bacterium]